MENITIQNSTELVRAAEILNTDVGQLTLGIFKFLNEWEMIDEYEAIGRTLLDIIEQDGSNISGFALNCLGTRNEEAIQLISELRVIWIGGECPECGYHMESETDGAHGKEWENARCLNGNCGHKTTTEPLTNFSFEDN